MFELGELHHLILRVLRVLKIDGRRRLVPRKCGDWIPEPFGEEVVLDPTPVVALYAEFSTMTGSKAEGLFPSYNRISLMA